ncbi:MAG TPA: 5'-3' exonuclease H3TH domain-containing protein [Verrucomicrobiae bacterium]|nr:5'-3' exonuclease H3TH domain-containing protein [Verrucomicrobiae bacterium]
MQRLLIIDGHAYAYRAFHAIRELRSPSGQPTNAVYGFIKMLAKMLATIGPTHLIVVWDGGLCAERMAALPEYKAQRPEMPEDLRPQLDGIGEYLDAAGIASYCGAGVEADDYIACLASHAVATGMNVVIASADKDFMQLVSERVGLLNPHDKTETVWTDEQVRGKTGLEPSQIVDWLSLRGDAVDNIAGVPGVGVKTATDLLQRFGSVDELYSRLDEVKSVKLRESLRASAEVVKRNRRLVKLRDDLECEFAPESMVAGKAADTVRLRELYQRWGFKGMLAALEMSAPAGQKILI